MLVLLFVDPAMKIRPGAGFFSVSPTAKLPKGLAMRREMVYNYDV